MSTSTNEIARQVVESGDVTNNDSNTTSNAPDYSEVAGQEYDALLSDDPTNKTKQVAAAMHVIHDRRPYVSTKHGQVRRQFEDDGNATRRIAREAVDGHSWGEAVTAELTDKQKATLASDKSKLNANEWAGAINSSTREETLPTNASVDQIVNAIIARRRK